MNNITKKFHSIVSDNTVKCECGHSVVFLDKCSKKLCTWCGHYIYKTKKDKFMDEMKRRIKYE